MTQQVNPDREGTLMAETKRLIKVRGDITLLQIYDDLAIPPGWVQKFTAGSFKNPSVNRVQALYEYLSGKPLAI